MAHIVPLSFPAMAAMGSVVLIFVAIKSPWRNRYHRVNNVSPKADLAWRNAAQQWLDNNRA
ncbi:uncharacterized protein SPAPADRAFT_58380 [Spathaspora passalidarum NRRL Y-27907]|uniref:Uncharacterized protein n=1 Tax=Spathaspora passalidarum (strain NRRL Y-27907 / 11-Y1) TaxID=619300 RepID=G3AG48_SPAPN|nr:uncharacterized protein SPAPADRAFT_58380 [Spathaspora passalidarum NRRL Y-27907]EGW35187.1 hypothetical protein SPAPADRAFT_58380 [Spathaspora passalidarum NRRL Y-27907]